MSHKYGTFYLLLCVQIAILKIVVQEKDTNEKGFQIFDGCIGYRFV